MINPHTAESGFDPLGRPLPHNSEAERNLLGAVLVDNAHLGAVESILTAEDFFIDPFRRIFKAIQRLSFEQQSVDITTLHDALHDDSLITDAGGVGLIASLTDGVPKIAPVDQWARIVHDASVLRTAANIGQAIIDDALESNAKAGEVIDRMQNRVAALSGLATGHVAGTMASEIEIEPVEWLWDGRVPLGKVTVLDGDPGLGKSAITLDLAARVSAGGRMPDGTTGISGGVLVMNAEDGEADTIVPRLVCMGADLTRIRILKTVHDASGERPPDLPGDLRSIERAAASVDARLIIIDPLMAFLSSRTNSFRDQDVRRALAPVATMAQRLRAAAVIVRHLNKAPDGNPLYRGGGSIGIIGAARSGLLVARDPDDDTGDGRVLAMTKTNLGPCAVSLRYVIKPESRWIKVQWCGESEHRAGTLLAIPDDGESRSVVDEAAEFLRTLLEDGSVPANEVRRKAKSAGFAGRTMDRAKKVVGVSARRDGFGKGSTWIWQIGSKNASEEVEAA